MDLERKRKCGSCLQGAHYGFSWETGWGTVQEICSWQGGTWLNNNVYHNIYRAFATC